MNLSDEALSALLSEDAARGWRAFVNQHTPTLLALIARAGVLRRDETMDVYVLVCERLSDDGCARLRRYDARRGPLGAWLAALVRHVVVDWVRSRAGRRRLFGSIRELDARQQRVFELYFWEQRTPADIAARLSSETAAEVALDEVIDALEAIERTLSSRQRLELTLFAARTAPPLSLEQDLAEEPPARSDTDADPEAALRVKQTDAGFARALAALPPEDAAILRLKYVQGLSRQEIQTALHLPALGEDRIRRILAALRAELRRQGVGASDAPATRLTFLQTREREDP